MAAEYAMHMGSSFDVIIILYVTQFPAAGCGNSSCSIVRVVKKQIFAPISWQQVYAAINRVWTISVNLIIRWLTFEPPFMWLTRFSEGGGGGGVGGRQGKGGNLVNISVG